MSITIEDRQVRRRLAILRHSQEVTDNVAMTCRYYGITRQSFYLWKRRYEELGPDGLKDRSRRPKTSPNATHVDVVGKILYLRQNYHFGPGKISMYLARYHDVSISSSGVWRILKRLGLNRLPASQRYKRLDRRWQRYEKQLPGHQVQIDVRFITPIAGAPGRKHYPFTAIDDCPGCGSCASTRGSTSAPPSSSPTTCSRSSRSRSRRSRPTTVPSSARRATTTCSTRASVTATSSPGHPA